MRRSLLLCARRARSYRPNPTIDASRAPNRSAARPPTTMKAAEKTREALTAHSTPAELSESSLRMFGRAAMIAVLLAPTASIATHDDHRTEPVRWLNVAMSSVRHRADETRAAAQRIVVYELPLNLAR